VKKRETRFYTIPVVWLHESLSTTSTLTALSKMGGNADVFSDSDKRARSCQDTTNSREKAVPLNESTMASITSTVIDPENRVCCSIN